MKTTITLLVVVLAATAVLAQAPPGPPSPVGRAQHQVKFMTTLLSLSSAQQQQATTIFTNAANAASNTRQAMKTAHQALEDAIKNNDVAGIDQAANTIGQPAWRALPKHEAGCEMRPNCAAGFARLGST